ncbi:MAG: methionyl-tRNA formyltransferase [Planctomycetes bacterium]|nr:methionyl-tRNA formyltransferase [Planctomycetota bacterium]
MQLIMMGTGDFAVPTFRRLIDGGYNLRLLVTQPDRPQGRHQQLAPAAIKQLALERGVDVFQPESVNTPESIERIASLRPDLLVVAAYGQILSDAVLRVPRLGGVNLHASLLPKYRGAAPVNWAIYHGETVTGVTVIRMTPRVDAGAILLQAQTPIGLDETASDLEVRLAELGAPLVGQAIDGLAVGTLLGRKQDRSQATQAPKLTREHGLIDWTRTAAGVCDQVRAMQPWPMAYTFFRRGGSGTVERLIIEGTLCEPSSSLPGRRSEPGMIAVGDDPGSLVVEAGDGFVRILRLRPAGKRSMTAEEFMRGHRAQPADRFGPER